MVEPISGGVVANIILGIAAVGGALWLAYEKWMSSNLKSANNEAGVAVADAQKTVYEMMAARLELLDAEVKELRKQVDAERLRRMDLERHVWKLEAVLHKARIDPPVLALVQ